MTLLTLVACGSDEAQPLAEAPSPANPAPRPLVVEVEGVVDIAVGMGSVWTTTRDDELVRIDPNDGSVVARIPLQVDRAGSKGELTAEGNVAVGATAVWVAVPEEGPPRGDQPDCSECFVDPNPSVQGTVLRVDPDTNRVVNTSTFQIDNQIHVALGARSVWVAHRGAVSRLDPDNAAVVSRVAVEHPGDLTVTDDSVWVTTPEEVLRLDAQHGRIVRAIPYRGAGLSPLAITHSPGAVWAAGPVMQRMGPQSNSIAQTYEDSEAESLSFGRGFLWATHVGESLIIRIDPQTNEVAHLLPPWEEDLPLGGVAAGPEGLWVIRSYSTVARVDGASRGWSGAIRHGQSRAGSAVLA